MTDSVGRRIARMRAAVHLTRPDRMPFWGRDTANCEYRKDIYHLGEVEFPVKPGEVVASSDGKRRYTADGGVWAVDSKLKYKGFEDVLNATPCAFAVEQVGQEMLGEMAAMVANGASRAYVTPLHYGTLVTRAVIEFGWEPFLLAAAVDAERLGALLDRFGAASVAVAEGWARTPGLELIIIHDDIAGTRGVFLSPDWYRRYAFPWYRRIFERIHSEGRKVLYLSDGNYLPVMDDVLATGADGFYVESSSMDPREVLRRGGRDKLYLIKSDSRTIDFGTPAEIREELETLRELHADHPGMFMYRGGGNPRPGNAEAFDRYVEELLVYER